MKKYQAPLAQVMNFDNDYVVTGSNGKNYTKPDGCTIPTGSGKYTESNPYGGGSTASLDY